jgi:hypothetical protein
MNKPSKFSQYLMDNHEWFFGELGVVATIVTAIAGVMIFGTISHCIVVIVRERYEMYLESKS